MGWTWRGVPGLSGRGGLRETAGFSSTELAPRVEWPITKISRMESGRRTSTTTDVILYAVVCGMTLPEAQPLLELTRRAERKQGYYLITAVNSDYTEDWVAGAVRT